jgi:hypothetical protein
MVQKLRKIEAEMMEKVGDMRKTAGRGKPPVAHPMKLQLQPTKANWPGPFSGFKMTIPDVY